MVNSHLCMTGLLAMDPLQSSNECGGILLLIMFEDCHKCLTCSIRVTSYKLIYSIGIETCWLFIGCVELL
jgi:hypothetical protein